MMKSVYQHTIPKAMNRSVAGLLVLLFLLVSVPLTVTAETSNGRIDLFGPDEKGWDHSATECYVGSDETTDYYRMPSLMQFDEDNNIRLRYHVDGGDLDCTLSTLQYKDGTEVAGGAIGGYEAGNSIRDLMISGLAPETEYRLFWEKDESHNMPKNVVLYFTTSKWFDPTVLGNDWIIFPENVSYIESDKDADYYQSREPLAFNDDKTLTFHYSVKNLKRNVPATIQGSDGSVPEGVTIEDSLDLSRTVTITNLAPQTQYRLVWKKDGAALTKKDVIMSFTTGKYPGTPELVSSEGKDLIAKTYTDLELKNAPGEGYEYKFIVYNERTNQWYKLQDFGPESTFRWYTGPEGKKTLYVDIKNKNDETDITRVALTGVNVTDSGLKATLAIEPTGELAAKSQAKLTATATGGKADYQYKFIVFNATTNQWYKLKDFGPESTFDWYTGPAGTKTLYVDVKDANGVVVREALENIVVK